MSDVGNCLTGNNQRSKKLTKEDKKKKIEDKRLAKKQRVKEMFDNEYDKATKGDGQENKFDARKAELDVQAKVLNHLYPLYFFVDDDWLTVISRTVMQMGFG